MNNKIIQIGSQVKIEFDDGDVRLVKVVSQNAGDIQEGWIGCNSPLGRALLGRCEKEEVVFAVTDRKIEVRILKIE